MTASYVTDPHTAETYNHNAPSTGRAHFSSLDITAFAVAVVMLLTPLAMAAYGAWTTPGV